MKKYISVLWNKKSHIYFNQMAQPIGWQYTDKCKRFTLNSPIKPYNYEPIKLG